MFAKFDSILSDPTTLKKYEKDVKCFFEKLENKQTQYFTAKGFIKKVLNIKQKKISKKVIDQFLNVAFKYKNLKYKSFSCVVGPDVLGHCSSKEQCRAEQIFKSVAGKQSCSDDGAMSAEEEGAASNEEPCTQEPVVEISANHNNQTEHLSFKEKRKIKTS